MLRTDLPKIITETVPGPKSQALIDRRKAATPSAIGCAYPVAIARGEGAMIEDLDGNKFLDWIGGVGVLNIGYSQPEVVEAVKAQADNYFHGMFNIVTHEGYVALAEKLSEIAPVKGDKKKAFFANSGAEADENAVKVAKAFTKRNNIIVFSGAFHGRTLLTMSMTSKKAYAIGDVPIGCVIVYEDKIIARGYNKRNKNKTTLAHAELLAMAKASKKLGDWRLEGCSMYVTLEPCQMCAGVILQARISKVVIGSMNPKAGCAGSIIHLLQMKQFNHQVEMETGILEEECSEMLSQFFKELRQKKKAEKLIDKKADV